MAGWNGSNWGTSFYDPSSAYGSTQYQPGEFADTGAGKQYINNEQEVAWTRNLAALGIDPNTAQGKFGRGLWPQVLEGYKAANLTNPNLRIEDYIQTIDPQAMYQNQTAGERGETPQANTIRARTIGRAYGAA